ncbi:MAG: hypothetical protein WC979_09140 [Candidatus Pacearchaeota archaeon]
MKKILLGVVFLMFILFSLILVNAESIGEDFKAGSPITLIQVCPACSSGNTITTIDSTGNVGGHSSITIGTDGLPIISYYDTTNGDLKVTHLGSIFGIPYWTRR